MEKVKTRSAKRVSDSKLAAVKAAAPVKITEKKASAPAASRRPITPADFVDRVQCKAYELFEQRGYSNGNDMGDWFEAERLVRAELGI